jgi:hypothetical protein
VSKTGDGRNLALARLGDSSAPTTRAYRGHFSPFINDRIARLEHIERARLEKPHALGGPATIAAPIGTVAVAAVCNGEFNIADARGRRVALAGRDTACPTAEAGRI